MGSYNNSRMRIERGEPNHGAPRSANRSLRCGSLNSEPIMYHSKRQNLKKHNYLFNNATNKNFIQYQETLFNKNEYFFLNRKLILLMKLLYVFPFRHAKFWKKLTSENGLKGLKIYTEQTSRVSHKRFLHWKLSLAQNYYHHTRNLPELKLI